MRLSSPGPLFRSGCLLVALLGAVFFSSGCDRLPEEVRLAAKKSEQRLEAAAKEIEVKRQALTSRLASDRYGYLKPYAEREGWEQSFQAASRQLERASELFRDKVKPILNRGLGLEKGYSANWGVLSGFIVIMGILLVVSSVAMAFRNRLMGGLGSRVRRDLRDRAYGPAGRCQGAGSRARRRGPVEANAASGRAHLAGRENRTRRRRLPGQEG